VSLVERAMAKFRTELAEPDTMEFPAPIDPATLPPDLAVAQSIVLDQSALAAASLLPDAQEVRRMADQYRRIKRPILDRVQALARENSPLARLVMLTSALPGDGKTFSSFNLARSIGRERDVSVLLVDADVAKPHITTVLGLNNQPGLLDLLADSSLDAESLILATDIPGLSVLPAGTRQESATELLSSSRMTEVAKNLMARDPRRIVLFDSPPMLLSSESRAIAQMVGQVVMMVRAGITPQEAVLEAMGHIGAEKLTGLVLNQCDLPSSGKHYGYGNYGEDLAASNE
jgi:protein-tyrosine kinase